MRTEYPKSSPPDLTASKIKKSEQYRSDKNYINQVCLIKTDSGDFRLLLRNKKLFNRKAQVIQIFMKGSAIQFFQDIKKLIKQLNDMQKLINNNKISIQQASSQVKKNLDEFRVNNQIVKYEFIEKYLAESSDIISTDHFKDIFNNMIEELQGVCKAYKKSDLSANFFVKCWKLFKKLVNRLVEKINIFQTRVALKDDDEFIDEPPMTVEERNVLITDSSFIVADKRLFVNDSLVVDEDKQVIVDVQADKNPLMLAAFNGDLEQVDKLIKSGCNLNKLNLNNETALSIAVKKGHIKIVNKLIEAGAKVNLGADEGISLLMTASLYGYVEIINVLLRHNADLDAVDSSGKNSLIYAASKGKLEAANLLLKHEININQQTKTKNTPLMFAVYHGHADIVTALIKQGAEINLKNENGKTAFDFTENKTILKILQEANQLKK